MISIEGEDSFAEVYMLRYLDEETTWKDTASGHVEMLRENVSVMTGPMNVLGEGHRVPLTPSHSVNVQLSDD